MTKKRSAHSGARGAPQASFGAAIDPGIIKGNDQRSRRSAISLNRSHWVISQEMVDIGHRKAVEMVNTRNFDGIHRFVEDANSKEDTKANRALSVLVGVSGTLLQILHSLRDQRSVTFTAPLPSVDDLIYDAKTDLARFAGAIQWQVDCFTRIFSSKLKFSSQTAGSEKTAEKPAGPLEVVIVEMPARKHITNLDYDNIGDVVGSYSLESDV